MMGGQQSIDGINDSITREAQQIAGMLDSGDAQTASEALRRASFDYEPDAFNQLVTAVEYMEQPQTGADLVIQPINNFDRHRPLPYHNSGRRSDIHQRNKVSERKLSMIEPDRDGNLYQADIAIMRTSVQQLAAVPMEASSQEVNAVTIPDETPYQNGAQLAEMMDTGYTNDALERLRRGAFNADSGQFAREIYAASNFEYKQQGADLTLSAVARDDNYYTSRHIPGQRHHNFWNDPFYGNQYPVSDSIVSVVAPNYNARDDYSQFLRADIAVISTSNEPLDAVRRPISR